MVKKIVGYDDAGKKVFEREAREYDKSFTNTVFGITLGDIVKGVPVIFLCAMLYANQNNFNARMIIQAAENAQAIGGIKEVLENINNYLSSSTGRQFERGRPR